jgi:hypothetical protein
VSGGGVMVVTGTRRGVGALRAYSPSRGPYRCLGIHAAPAPRVYCTGASRSVGGSSGSVGAVGLQG